MTPIIQQQPGQVYRIDKFQVPEAARAEFIQNVSNTQAFIQTLPGFVQDFIFGQSGGPGTFNLITMVVWESADALDSAKQAVLAKHAEIGLNPKELFDRLGIQADLAHYSQLEVSHATQ